MITRPRLSGQCTLAFLWREKRKVRRNATISFQSNTYQVDPSLAGRSLELRYDPFDLSRIELYLNDADGRVHQYLGTATLDFGQIFYGNQKPVL